MGGMRKGQTPLKLKNVSVSSDDKHIVEPHHEVWVWPALKHTHYEADRHRGCLEP